MRFCRKTQYGLCPYKKETQIHISKEVTDEKRHLQAKVSGFRRDGTYPDPSSPGTGLVSVI